MENSLQVVIDEKKIAKENAALLLEAYGAPFTEAGKILATYDKIKVTDESQTDLMQEAREKRLALKKIRTGVENKRKELKENINAQAQAIDGVARYIKETIEPAEEYLELQERFAEIKAAERAAKLKAERIEQLSAYSDNLSIYNLDTMDEPTFQTLLKELKDAHEAKAAEAKRIENARIAKEKADAEAAEKQRKENERLKKEAEEREVWIAMVKSRINKLYSLGFSAPALDSDDYVLDHIVISQKQIDEGDGAWFSAQIEKAEAYVKERNAAVEKERQENEAKVQAEREKAQKLEQEKRDREAAEAKAKADAEEAERQALLAPDKDKIIAFANALTLVRTQKIPAVKTKQAQDVLSLVDKELASLSEKILNAAKHL